MVSSSYRTGDATWRLYLFSNKDQANALPERVIDNFRQTSGMTPAERLGDLRRHVGGATKIRVLDTGDPQVIFAYEIDNYFLGKAGRVMETYEDGKLTRVEYEGPGAHSDCFTPEAWKVFRSQS